MIKNDWDVTELRTPKINKTPDYNTSGNGSNFLVTVIRVDKNFYFRSGTPNYYYLATDRMRLYSHKVLMMREGASIAEIMYDSKLFRVGNVFSPKGKLLHGVGSSISLYHDTNVTLDRFYESHGKLSMVFNGENKIYHYPIVSLAI